MDVTRNIWSDGLVLFRDDYRRVQQRRFQAWSWKYFPNADVRLVQAWRHLKPLEREAYELLGYWFYEVPTTAAREAKAEFWNTVDAISKGGLRFARAGERKPYQFVIRNGFGVALENGEVVGDNEDAEEGENFVVDLGIVAPVIPPPPVVASPVIPPVVASPVIPPVVASPVIAPVIAPVNLPDAPLGERVAVPGPCRRSLRHRRAPIRRDMVMVPYSQSRGVRVAEGENSVRGRAGIAPRSLRSRPNVLPVRRGVARRRN